MRLPCGFLLILLALPRAADGDVVFSAPSALDGLSSGQQTEDGLTITYDVGGDTISVNSNLLGIDSGVGDSAPTEINGNELLTISFDQEVLFLGMDFALLGAGEFAEVTMPGFGTIPFPGDFSGASVPLAAGQTVTLGAFLTSSFQLQSVQAAATGGGTELPEPSSLVLAGMVLGVIGLRKVRGRRKATTAD